MTGEVPAGKVMFYHLTRHSPLVLIRRLSERSLASGARVMIRGADGDSLRRYDEALWTDPPESFLPHGMEGTEYAAEQPVLLGLGPAVNGAKVLLLLAGAKVDPEEARAMERTCLLFEDADPAQVHAARAEWKAVVAAGLTAEYWADSSGRWEKKAESGRPG